MLRVQERAILDPNGTLLRRRAVAYKRGERKDADANYRGVFTHASASSRLLNTRESLAASPAWISAVRPAPNSPSMLVETTVAQRPVNRRARRIDWLKTRNASTNA